jgi:hypothetical protein
MHIYANLFFLILNFNRKLNLLKSHKNRFYNIFAVIYKTLHLLLFKILLNDL